MQQYLQKVVGHLVAPKATFNTSFLSPMRVFNRHKMLKQCMKSLNYGREQELHRQIAFAYYGLHEAIQEKDEPLLLRNLSIDLFEQYRESPALFKLADQISDIVVVDCVKAKEEGGSGEWYQLYVKIKHFSRSHHYSLERKIFADDYQVQVSTIRKWYFTELPLDCS